VEQCGGDIMQLLKRPGAMKTRLKRVEETPHKKVDGVKGGIGAREETGKKKRKTVEKGGGNGRRS